MASEPAATSPSSFDDMLFLYKLFLRLVGILPFEGRDLTYSASRLLVIYSILTTLTHSSMFVCYMINGNKVPTIDTICETVIVLGLGTRYYLLLPRRLELTRLLDDCRAIWDECDEADRRAVRKFEQKIRLVFQFLLVSCVFINIMYSVSAASMTVRANLESNDTRILYLPYRWYTDNGAYLWPGYKIIFVVQVLVVHNAGLVVTSVDSVGPLLIMIAAGYFRALRQRLLRLSCSRVERVDADGSELVDCARLHQRILDLCFRIDRITRTVFFVQLLTTTYIVSMMGIKLIGLSFSDPDRYKFIPVLSLNLGQLFICQWAPDHLITESLAISTAASCDTLTWMRNRLGKLLVLIITRSQHPVQMTAAGVVNLSLEKFLSMLTSAFSFFTVLRNFNV